MDPVTTEQGELQADQRSESETETKLDSAVFSSSSVRTAVVGTLLVTAGCGGGAVMDKPAVSSNPDTDQIKSSTTQSQEDRIKSMPSDPAVLELLASGHLEAGNYNKAIEVYQRAIELSPEKESLQEALGYALMKAERYGEAIEVYRNWTLIAPDNVEAHTGVARAADKLGDHLIVEASLRTVLELDSNNVSAKSMLASNLFEQQRYSEARDAYQSLLTEIGSTQSDSWVASINKRLARLSKELGDFDSAIQYFEKSIELDSGDQKSIFELASLHLELAENKDNGITRTQKQQHRREALEGFEKLTQLRADYAPYFMRTAQLAQSLGQLSKADQFAREGMKLDPAQAGWGNVILGRSASKRGDSAFNQKSYDEAYQHYSTAETYFERAAASADKRFKSYARKEVGRQNALMLRAKKAQQQ